MSGRVINLWITFTDADNRAEEHQPRVPEASRVGELREWHDDVVWPWVFHRRWSRLFPTGNETGENHGRNENSRNLKAVLGSW